MGHMTKKQDEQGKLEYSLVVKEAFLSDGIDYAEVLERNEGDLYWRSLCSCEREKAEEIAAALQWRADFLWEQQQSLPAVSNA